MATFAEVFSTTGKVALALLIIGMVMWAVVAVVNSNSERSAAEAKIDFYTKRQADRDAEYDKVPTRMAASKWRTVVAAASKQKCIVIGMTKEEVEAALGKPSVATDHGSGTVGDTWTYRRDLPGCIRFSGDTCIEHDSQQEIIFFTPSGHVSIGTSGGPCLQDPFWSKYYLPLHLSY
jgi:hypothetical protein